MTYGEAAFLEGELVKFLESESKERVEHTKAAIRAAAARPTLF